MTAVDPITQRVDGARLLADLRALAAIGATTAGGVSRPAYC